METATFETFASTGPRSRDRFDPAVTPALQAKAMGRMAVITFENFTSAGLQWQDQFELVAKPARQQGRWPYGKCQNRQIHPGRHAGNEADPARSRRPDGKCKIRQIHLGRHPGNEADPARSRWPDGKRKIRQFHPAGQAAWSAPLE